MTPQVANSAIAASVHLQNSDPGLRHTCPFCQRTFNKNEHVLRHIRSHTKERPYRCKHCHKTYPRKDTLQRHERGHQKPADESNGAEVNSAQKDDRNDETGQVATRAMRSSIDDSNNIAFTASRTDPVTLQSCVDPAIYQTSLPLAQHTLTQESPLVDSAAGSNFNAPTVYNAHDPYRPYEPMLGVEQHNVHNDIMVYDDTDLDQYGWLLSSNFDIGAVDSALNNTLYEWAQAYPPANVEPLLTEPSLPINPLSGNPQTTQSVSIQHPLPTQPEDITSSSERTGTSTPQTATDSTGVRFPFVQRWFARLQPDECPSRARKLISRAPSEDPGEELNIDERYTTTLSKHLRPRQYEETSLSVQYLNRCLRLYYDRFHPIFPVVHFPTFRSNSENALLVLSMCSIGSLFIRGSESLSQGHNIYSRLNKAILASWETYLSGTPQNALSMVQAALIGQTFGLISSSSHSLIMTDVFQGTMISWARKLGYFGQPSPEWPPANLELKAKIRAWRSWVHGEQIRRLVLALHIHDAELSSLLHHEPLLRHSSVQYTATVNDTLFEAPSAARWYEILMTSPQQQQETGRLLPIKIRNWTGGAWSRTDNSITASIKISRFTSYAVLENINATIIEARSANDLDLARRQTLTESLVTWARISYPYGLANSIDYLNLKVLWHSCFMALCADFDILERSVGREGPSNAATCAEEVASWASSPDAARCLLHAIALKDLVEAMRLNCTPAIHVPRALFNAGLILICHHCWQISPPCSPSKQDEAIDWDHIIDEFPEFHASLWQSRNADSGVFGSLRQKAKSYYPNALYGILELLQRLDRWSISSCFAGVLQEASFETL